MTIYFFPGFSGEYNQPEMNAIADYLRGEDMQVETVEWPHWSDKDVEFDLDEEVAKVWQRISKMGDDEVTIVAKSIGTHVAIRLLELHKEFEPQTILLMGVPVESIDEADLRSYPEMLNRLGNSKIVVIQNEHDPFGSSDQVKLLLEGVDAQIIVKSGVDTHAYTYPEEVHELID